jgi:iron-sulfur cluster assembly protein
MHFGVRENPWRCDNLDFDNDNDNDNEHVNRKEVFKMAVTLTEAAASHVAGMLNQRGSGLGLRVGTKKSGCTGYTYDVDYADAVDAGDRVFESHGVKVVVDGAALEQIDGLEIDYVRASLLHQGFEFRNPRVKNTCGCGESFNV